uniref:Uncharacterized protein n=1 Tax=Terrapene triunguis TaxID=2587831 RepID=A0A674J2T6_9SAUR
QTHFMKSLWNCGSITCIMYLIWEGSQRSMSSSRASSFSGPLHLWGERQRGKACAPQQLCRPLPSHVTQGWEL